MTGVSLEYEIKTKMVQEQWLQLKLKFYWVKLKIRGNKQICDWQWGLTPSLQ